MNRSGEPAFPGRNDEDDFWINGHEGRSIGDCGEHESAAWPGMTIREHFASMAMQGMIGGQGDQLPVSLTIFQDYEAKLARQAVRFADALIAELSKPMPQEN